MYTLSEIRSHTPPCILHYQKEDFFDTFNFQRKYFFFKYTKTYIYLILLEEERKKKLFHQGEVNAPIHFKGEKLN